MKFLVFADVHIRNYSKFTKWTTVIPERLKININLAKDILRISKKENVNDIIIAGDLLDIAISPPMVLNVVDDFLSILSSDCNITLTHGQHDISTKTVDEYLKQLTSLSIFESDKIKFYHDEVINIGDNKIFFYGWSNILPEFKDADIFIGHGMVKGSKNVLNYTFQNGYDPEILSKKYKFSVIGDIHKSQSFFGNVLIPGPPIQNSFKDDPNTGVWIVDTDDWSYKFCPIDDDIYPKFFYVDDKSNVPSDKPDNHFYQVLSSGRHKKVSDKIKDSNISLDLWAIIESIILSVKDVRHDVLVQLARKVYDTAISTPTESRYMPQVLINNIKVKNFFSIKDLNLDLPTGIVSIVGDIGSGKSTLLEAICWGLYGVTSKGKFKDDLLPITYSASGDTVVDISYSINENNYLISRSINKLEFFMNDSHVSGSRMSDTQQIIEDTLQLSFAEFSCLVYFNQESGSFFGNLKNSQQMALMTMFLSQQDQYLDKMIELVSSSHKKYMEDTLKVKGAISNLATLNERNTHKYNEYKSYQVSLRDRQIDSLRYSAYKDCSMDIIDLLIQDNLIGAINKYFNIDYEEEVEYLKEIKNKNNTLLTNKLTNELQVSKLNTKHTLCNTSIDKLLKKIRSNKLGTCPECKQKLPINEEELRKIANEIKSLNEEKISIENNIENLKNEIKKYLDLIAKNEKIIKEKSVIFSKCDDFKKYKQDEIIIDMAEMTVLESSIKEFDLQKQELESQQLSYEELWKLYEVLYKKVFNDKAIKSRCVEYIGKHLSSEVNALLESIDSNLEITINTVTYNKSGGLSSGFDVLAKFDDVNINYRNASGGQKMLIDISSVISIYNLLSSIYNLPNGIFGFLALDESIKYLDSKNIDTVKDIINCVRARSVFVISHDEKLNSILSDTLLQVNLDNGISNYNLI